ncbi:MAG: hypothetical protein KF795_01890 [Labilithrix sp.]|nr:hypothetical protein [Labilithrix sp.]
MLLLSSCSLLLADDLKQSPEANGTLDGGPRDGDGAPIGEGGRDGSTTDGASSTLRRPLGPLVLNVNGDLISTRVEGFFGLEFAGSRSWKPTRLLDLGLPDNDKTATMPLASALFEPFSATIEGKTVATSTDADWGYFQLVDETPVRVAFTTWAHHYLPSGADAKIWTDWTIYASGRVVAQARVQNVGTAALALPSDWRHTGTSVDTTRTWNVAEAPDARSATFYHDDPSGLGTTTLLQDTPAKLGASSPAERHWQGSAQTLAEGESVTKVNELHFGVVPDEALARVADAQRPALDALSNVSQIDLGYDLTKAAYRLRVLAAGPATMTFSLSTALLRAYPAFELDDLDAPNGWRVQLDGQTIASSSATVTPLGVGRYAAADRRLLFVYFGTIAPDVPASKRMFTVERL